MNEPTTDELPTPARIETITRIELAAALLGVEPPADELVGAWVRGLPDGAEHVGVTTSVTGGRRTWRAAGDPAAFLEPMAAFFDHVGADRERLAQLTDVGRRLAPARIGSFLQTRGSDIDAGWYAPVSLRVDDLWAFSPDCAARSTLAAWLDDEDVEEVAGFERSLGPADHAGFWIPLPGRGPEQQLTAVAELMDDLDLGSLRPDLVGILGADERAALVASLWLIPEGVARVSVAILDPEPSQLIAMSMALGVDEDDRLARVQGAMDADGPALVEVAVYAETFDVEVGWDLPVG